MASQPGFDFDGTITTGVTYTPQASVNHFTHMRGMIFCASNQSVEVRWSQNGVDADYIDIITVTAGNTESFSLPIRSKYVYLEFTTTITPSASRRQFFFYDGSAGIHVLDNVGTGAKLYKPTEQKIRTVISSDGSVVVSETVNEVDVSVSSLVSPVSLSNAGGTSLIKDGTGPAMELYGLTGDNDTRLTTNLNDVTIDVGRNASGTNTLVMNAQAVKTIGNDSTVFGIDAGQTGVSTSNVLIGYRAGQNNPQYNNTLVGVGSGRFNSGFNNVGLGVSTFQTGSSTNCVALGSFASLEGAGEGSISIGYNAGETRCGIESIQIGKNCATVDSGDYTIQIGSSAANSITPITDHYAVYIGRGCARQATAGRLSFGSNMEAPTAISAVSVEAPTGLLNLSWNGTAYRLPLLSSTATDLLVGSATTKSYGMFEHSGGSYTVSSNYIITDGGTVTASNNFDNGGSNNGTLRYTGTVSKVFRIQGVLYPFDGAVYEVYLRINAGTLSAKTLDLPANTSAPAVLETIRTLNQNDTINIGVDVITSFTCYGYSLCAIEI